MLFADWVILLIEKYIFGTNYWIKTSNGAKEFKIKLHCF